MTIIISRWPRGCGLPSTPGGFGEVPTEIGCQRCGPDGGFCVAWLVRERSWEPQLTNENARMGVSSSPWGYPNSWMVCEGKYQSKIDGTPHMIINDLYRVLGLGFNWRLGLATPWAWSLLSIWGQIIWQEIVLGLKQKACSSKAARLEVAGGHRVLSSILSSKVSNLIRNKWNNPTFHFDLGGHEWSHHQLISADVAPSCFHISSPCTQVEMAMLPSDVIHTLATGPTPPSWIIGGMASL